jgi:hypothetical protein
MHVPLCHELMVLEKIIVAIVVELSILLVLAVFGGARLRACAGELSPEIDLR